MQRNRQRVVVVLSLVTSLIAVRFQQAHAKMVNPPAPGDPFHICTYGATQCPIDVDGYCAYLESFFAGNSCWLSYGSECTAPLTEDCPLAVYNSATNEWDEITGGIDCSFSYASDAPGC